MEWEEYPYQPVASNRIAYLEQDLSQHALEAGVLRTRATSCFEIFSAYQSFPQGP